MPSEFSKETGISLGRLFGLRLRHWRDFSHHQPPHGSSATQGDHFMLRLIPSAALLVLISATVPLGAQETPGAKKHENSSWFWMENVKFKPGKMEDAMKVISEHFAPAGDAVGMKGVRVLHHLGGQWDLTIVFPMAEGPRALEWAVSPDDAKWMGELARRQKGMGNAMALLARYSDMVARQESTLIREQR